MFKLKEYIGLERLRKINESLSMRIDKYDLELIFELRIYPLLSGHNGGFS